MGASTTLFAAQQNATKIASLTLFGFGQDLDFKYPEVSTDKKLQKKVNTAVHAASDFISPGNISQKAIDTYVKVALEHDPIKVDWRFGGQFNKIDPSLITIPVLVLQGALDPIGTAEKQTKLFTRLKTADKSWVVFSGGGHAAHLETSRKHFIHSFTSFIDRFNE
jgi:alpha-beta hydrolase superfamily lysophospholipase